MHELAKPAANTVLPLITLLAACSSLSVERIENDGAGVTKNGGLPYSLEKPVILANIQRSLVYDGQHIVGGVDTGSAIDTTTFSLALLKDPGQTYAIKLNPGWFTADTQDIVYNARGGFNSFNFTSTDQTPTVVATIGKIAATAALFAVSATIEDAPQPPGSGQIETATLKGYQKVLRDLATLSEKAGALSRDDLALFDSLLKEAQSLKPLIYPATTHTIQVIDVPIVFVDSSDKSIDDLISNDPNQYYSKANLGLIGIARRLK